MNVKKIAAVVVAVVLLGSGSAFAAPNYIQNPSFETVPSGATGQGILPSNWQSLPEVIPPGADTYSNDGSYGLAPAAFGNFPGVTAYDGIRWVAGWSITPEAFGQQMSSPLKANRLYQLSARLIMPQRADISHPGTYQVSLASDLNRTNEQILGALQPPGPLTNTWTLATLNWDTLGMTQAQVDVYTHIIFTPLVNTNGEYDEELHTYAGIDNLVLDEEIPEPATMGLLAVGSVAALIRRKKKLNR